MSVKKRIESVDILRGFTILAMILVNTPGDWGHVYKPLLHANWHGLTPTDLIFPFFLFIVGISIFFAYKNKSRSKVTYRKIVVRSLKLIGLGLFLNVFLPYFPFIVDLETARIPGVLQRIGLVFLISSIVYLHFNWKGILAISVTILIGYWLFLGFMPFPNGSGISPTFDRAPHNWANYIDLRLLGNHMWKPDYDPEGLFSTLPAIVSCLFGVLTGKLLTVINKNNVVYLFLVALVLLLVGYLFSLWFPINKSIWSSSFVFVSTGWGVLFLSVIYYLTDVLNFKFGTIFKYVGMNAITIYFSSSFITKSMYFIKVGASSNLHAWLYNSLFVNPTFSLQQSSLLYAISVVIFYILLSYLLFKKRIFIKI